MQNDIERPGGPSQAEPVVSALRASVPDAWPEIEYEESYPVDEDFEAIKALPYDFVKAAAWLYAELPRAAENMPCGCWIEDNKSIIGKPVKLINFSTYGWSGAEAITALIESRYDLRYFMLKWQRGGHYVFELPAQGMSASGQDAQQLEAKPASPVHAPDEEQSNAG